MNYLAEPVVAENDPVSMLLERTYLPGWRCAEITLGSPWRVGVPGSVACLYVVLQGQANFRCDELNLNRDLTVGDHLVTTRGAAHEICSSSLAPLTAMEELFERTPRGRLRLGDIPQNGSPGDETVLLFGRFDLTGLRKNPLDVGLPDVVVLNHDQSPELSLCGPTLQLLRTFVREQPAGWDAMARQLSSTILLQTIAHEIRRGATDSCENDGDAYRLMRASTDTVIGPVLRVLIDQPEAPWTVPEMARLAKVSKSAFSDRFRRLVGSPPLQYLTEIRMVKSRRLLRGSEVDISDIATLVGYESPSSFSNVFKRWHGESPVQYRRGDQYRRRDQY